MRWSHLQMGYVTQLYLGQPIASGGGPYDQPLDLGGFGYTLWKFSTLFAMEHRLKHGDFRYIYIYIAL